jgi:hypothetical protein
MYILIDVSELDFSPSQIAKLKTSQFIPVFDVEESGGERNVRRRLLSPTNCYFGNKHEE